MAEGALCYLDELALIRPGPYRLRAKTRSAYGGAPPTDARHLSLCSPRPKTPFPAKVTPLGENCVYAGRLHRRKGLTRR